MNFSQASRAPKDPGLQEGTWQCPSHALWMGNGHEKSHTAWTLASGY